MNVCKLIQRMDEYYKTLWVEGVKMVQIRKTGMTPKEVSELENADAVSAKNTANIDYLAMMADIEIPTEEGMNDE